jgi:glycerol-3-phosphate acyltransferase PlsX
LRKKSGPRRVAASRAEPIRVAVDANGADLGPREVAEGARQAAAEGIEVVVYGPAAALGRLGPGVEVRDSPVSIAKVPDPVRAVRANPEASIVQAAASVGTGEAGALVCAGTTGTAVAAAFLKIGRLPGIHRPALAVLLPQPRSNRRLLLLDVGANADCRPEHLAQFALMGAAFSRAVLGVAKPAVALLSNGSEPERGSEAVIEAHRRLAALAGSGRLPFRFAGNIEGHRLFAGEVDVAVCDGFAGNIALKTAEGVAEGLVKGIGDRVKGNPIALLGGVLLWPAVRGLRSAADPERSGGAYLLGLKRPVVVAHGRFRARGFAAAIRLAAQAAALPDQIAAELQATGLSRTAIRSGR